MNINTDENYWSHHITCHNLPFITCLSPYDQISFTKWFAIKLTNASISFERKHEILKMGIKLSIWINAIKELSYNNQLKHSYSLIRKAFWGETRGYKKINNLTTSYTVLIKEFTLPTSLSRIYIMYDNNQLTQIPYSHLKPAFKFDKDHNEHIVNDGILIASL